MMGKKQLASVWPLQEIPREKSRAHSRSQRGETLIETLIGLLIAGLSIVMVSAAIATASRLIIKTRDMAETYEVSTQTLAPGTGTSSGTVTITPESGNKLSYGGTVNVTYTESELPGSKTGVTYSPTTTSSSSS